MILIWYSYGITIDGQNLAPPQYSPQRPPFAPQDLILGAEGRGAMSWVNFEIRGGKEAGGGSPAQQIGTAEQGTPDTTLARERRVRARLEDQGPGRKKKGLRIVAKQLPVTTDSLGSEATARDAHCATSRAHCLREHAPIYLLGATCASIVAQFAKCVAHARRNTVQGLCCFTRCKI